MKKGLLILFILSSFNSKGTIHQIGIWGGYYQFVPGSITIQLGDTIEWEPFFGLLPTMPHTITSDNIPVGAVSFDQIWQMPADTFFQYIPQVAGLYQYVCTPHILNGMIGEFTVTNGSNTQTYVPDDNFENYLEIWGMGDGIMLNDTVLTGNINGVTNLDVNNQNISDLTGIEDFTALTWLNCGYNQLTSLDVSNNTALGSFGCEHNQLTSLDVSANINLEYLGCNNNQLTSLDVSQNTALGGLTCSSNQLSSLDVSNNTALYNLTCPSNQLTSLDLSNNTDLEELRCYDNQLTSLDLRNIILSNFSMGISTNGNSQLFCIDVDYPLQVPFINIVADPWTSFSTNCTTEIYGCTDSLACNYIPNATIDDGSCVYPGIWYQTHLICDGDSIVVGSSVYDTAGAYMDTLNASNGCDSIVNTYLMIDENTSSYDTLSVTASIVWNGMPINVSGDYSVTLNNLAGCDSIVNLNLTVTTTGISDITNNKSNLVKITDMLGQETPYRRNTPLFYIYDDGTVEKIIIIE